jgi:hypothetical protein
MPHLLHYSMEANQTEMQARILCAVHDKAAEREKETLPALPRERYHGC